MLRRTWWDPPPSPEGRLDRFPVHNREAWRVTSETKDVCDEEGVDSRAAFRRSRSRCSQRRRF